jgi:protein-S-isoprenylcysteine O-methyltransferase Ste14
MQVIDGIPLASFLYILIFLMGRIQFLKREGTKTSSGIGNLKKRAIFLYPVFIFIFLLWLFEIAKPVFKVSFSILPEILTTRLFDCILLKISGLTLILLSLGLLTITLIHFKTSLRFGFNENNLGRLVTTGMFSLSRNPFFLSLDFYFFGVALILPSLFFISFMVLAIISIHFFILKEERFMKKVYGEEYEKYEKKVRRYC